ncbi:hypothetical protein JCM8547_001338 [Rhodosporidiobolus lusitaniae]
MASFSSLPPELVAEIVQLAVPPFNVDDKTGERTKALLALCLTCRTILEPARRLLLSEVCLAARQHPEFLAALCASSRAVNANFVEIQDDPAVYLTDLEPVEASTLIFQNSTLSKLPTSLYFLTPQAMPNLRTLALHENFVVGKRMIHDWTSTEIPLLAPLKAVAIGRVSPKTALSGNVGVVDVWHMPSDTLEALLRPISSSLRILRIIGWFPGARLSRILDFLSSFSSSSLSEVHLGNLAHDEIEGCRHRLATLKA